MEIFGYVGDELHKAKQERIQKSLKKWNLDAILFFEIDSVRYLTDFFTTMGRPFVEIPWTAYLALVPRGKEAMLGWSGLTDTHRIQAGRCPCENRRLPPLKEWPRAIKAMLNECGITKGRIGVGYIPSLTFYLNLRKELPGVEFVDASDFWQELKAVKHPIEIEYIREAFIITEIGVKAALNAIEEGKRETDVAAAASYAMKMEGSEMDAFLPIVLSGENAVTFERFSTYKRIRNGDLVFLDMGAIYKGYAGDLGRTVICGKPTEKQKEVYRVTLSALKTGIEVIGPGVKCGDVDAAVRKVIRDAGYGRYEHKRATGHQVGFGPASEPIIGPGINTKLEPNMVVCLEPRIIVDDIPLSEPALFGHLEDGILVTEAGHEVLTRTEYDEKLLG